VINLYSDTQTRPTDAMRQAIASAEVADEQRGADPTTNLLQERVQDRERALADSADPYGQGPAPRRTRDG